MEKLHKTKLHYTPDMILNQRTLGAPSETEYGLLGGGQVPCTPRQGLNHRLGLAHRMTLRHVP